MTAKDKKDMAAFLKSGRAPGSKEFRNLKPNVQKGILKVSLCGIEVIIKRTRNPFTKIRYATAKFSYDRLLKSMKEDSKPKKDKKEKKKK